MRARLVLTLFCAALAGMVCGWYLTNPNRETVLAMAWGGGKYGPAFYGARVTLETEAKGYAVRSIILIAPDSLGEVSYQHDCGVIGHVASYAEATGRFGVVVWRPDGLHIGAYFLPQGIIESHR